MKHLINILILLVGIVILVGCVEDEAETGYYSSGGSTSGYVTTYSGDVTSGYNRDFNKPSNSNKQNNNQASSSNNSAPNSNSGYSSNVS